jgi:hypothetical protein
VPNAKPSQQHSGSKTQWLAQHKTGAVATIKAMVDPTIIFKFNAATTSAIWLVSIMLTTD